MARCGRLKGKESWGFRIYPESVHGFYFEVEIFSSKAAMWEAVDAFKKKAGERAVRPRNYAAMVTPYRVANYEKGRKRPGCRKVVGKIWLSQNDMDSEVVAHECVHAGLRWVEEMGIVVVGEGATVTARSGNVMDKSCGEERLAYAVGRMVNQIAGVGWREGFFSAKDEKKKAKSDG